MDEYMHVMKMNACHEARESLAEFQRSEVHVSWAFVTEVSVMFLLFVRRTQLLLL